jgi:hypothetical protein
MPLPADTRQIPERWFRVTQPRQVPQLPLVWHSWFQTLGWALSVSNLRRLPFAIGVCCELRLMLEAMREELVGLRACEEVAGRRPAFLNDCCPILQVFFASIQFFPSIVVAVYRNFQVTHG